MGPDHMAIPCPHENYTWNPTLDKGAIFFEVCNTIFRSSGLKHATIDSQLKNQERKL